MVAPSRVVELGWVSSPEPTAMGAACCWQLPCQGIAHLVHAPVIPILLASRREPPGPRGCKETHEGVRWG